MPYFRVSRNKYNIDEEIREAEIGSSASANIELFKSFIAANNEKAILNIPKLPLDQQSSAASALKEAALEIVRTTDFPELPCRYSNMMIFDSIDNAKNFLKTYRPQGNIYELEINTNSQLFVGDMKIIDFLPDAKIANLKSMAIKYWSGYMSPTPLKEAILPNSISARIIKIHT